MKINNSKNLQVGNIVRHERGWVGRVIAVEQIPVENGDKFITTDGRQYHSSDEVEVDWFAADSGMVAPRTSSIYLTKISES